MMVENQPEGTSGGVRDAQADPPPPQRPPEMLAFFPWLRLREHPTVGPYELLPYSRGDEPAGEGTALQATLDTILEPYIAARADPIDDATLICYGGRDLTAQLTEEERTCMFEFSELLAFAGLAARKYFRHAYWNRDQFRFVIQSFARADGGAWIHTRRRDGGTRSYWPHEHYTVARPVHVGTEAVVLDHALLRALLDLQDADDWTRYREAIETFNLANTDSADLREEVELVLINGAFERLFDLDRGREAELADAFRTCVSPSTDVAFSDCERFAGRPDAADRVGARASLRDAWIRDFFRVRNNLAHGRRESVYPALWNLREHLLLACFIFPVAFKATLEQEGRYELSDDDRCYIDAFEALACADHFTESARDGAVFPWERIIRSAGVARRIHHFFAARDGE